MELYGQLRVEGEHVLGLGLDAAVLSGYWARARASLLARLQQSGLTRHPFLSSFMGSVQRLQARGGR